MRRSGMLLAAVALLWGCGEVENKTNEVKGKATNRFLAETLDSTNSFHATLLDSPLGLADFEGRVHYVRIRESRVDMPGMYKIDIMSGGGSLNFGGGAVNHFQGASIEVFQWNGTPQEIPIVNPHERPHDGRAYAVVAYSESKRDGVSSSNDQDWYTWVTQGGTLYITAADVSANGGVRGHIDYDVLLVEPDLPRPPVDEAPKVRFEGEFNLRSDASIEQLLFR
jgi:hypothetical protein